MAIVIGTAANDVLAGTNGEDTLNGLTGADKMSGGAGNDLYVVTDDLDTVTENAKEGIDTVESSVSFNLGANVENLSLAGAAVRGTGNELANIIEGNNAGNELDGLDGNDTLNGNGGNDGLNGGAGNDILNGGDGNDILIGGAGNDFLFGNDGNDTLDGGDGDDKMAGGKGDDFYQVDSAKDVVIESANQGFDTVESFISFTLGANLEQLILDREGDSDINGTGNALNNSIIGSAGENRIDGGTGNDDLEGRDGNDTLIGGAGNDFLEGGQGADLMDGGAGRDVFRYEIDNPADLANLGGDIINGFQHGQDRIDLSDLLIDFDIKSADAFSGGFLKIEVVGNNTRILFDQDGGGDDFITLATLNNVRNVTADDLFTTPV